MNAPRAWRLTDGRFHEGASVPLTDRGFRHGMSVFETFAIRRGRVLFLAEHADRLERACRAASFRTGFQAALAALELAGNGLLRVYVTAGDGPPISSAAEPRVFALFEAAEFPAAAEIVVGFRVGVGELWPPVLGGWKTGCYWPAVQRLRYARDEGFDEVLLADIEGAVVSAAMANVFFAVEGRLVTPPLQSGARDGVIRDWVCRQERVREELIKLDDLEECFLTNSRLGVMPVVEIAGRRLPGRACGDRLASLYRECFLRD